MEWLAKIFLKIAAGPVLSFASGVIKNLSDAHVAVVTAQTGLAASEAAGVIEAERTRTVVQGNTVLAAMSHPIWWAGWAMFVFPFGAYVAIIHIKSIACPFFESACTWNIPEIPKQIEAWDNPIVLSFFGLAAASPVIGAIANRLGAVAK